MTKTPERIRRIRSLLEGRGQRLMAGWQGSGRLERTFLLVVYVPVSGKPRVARVAGTIKSNRDCGQDMVYYAADLVRVMSGRRKGLAAVHESLRDDETFAPAGMFRDLTDEPGVGFGLESARELELLSNVEAMAHRPVVESPELPEPAIKKVAIKPETFVPRFTGETYRVVRTAPGYEDGESMLDNFNRLVTKIAIKRDDGSYELSFNLAARGGLTVMDARSDVSWSLPAGGLDRRSDLFEVSVIKSIKKGRSYGGDTVAEGAPGP